MKEKLKLENKDLKTLVSCINALVHEGFTDNYKVTDDGLKSLKLDKTYKPDQVNVLSFYRFEGNSDPADNSILFAIETIDGDRGTLVDAFGPYADTKVTHFMEQVDHISKRTEHGKII